MQRGFATFKVIFLLPRIANAAAVEDLKAPGWYRHEDMIVAGSKRLAIAEIRDKGGVPVEVRQHQASGFSWKELMGSNVSNDYKIQFLLALNFHLQAGSSPGRALRSVIESETGPARRMLNLSHNVLDKGGTFADAIAASGIFDETTAAILEAGERSGSLREAMTSAIEFQNSRQNAVKIMFGAITWTAVDLFFAVSSVIGNRFYFLPSIRSQGIQSDDKDEVEKFNRALDLAFDINNAMVAITVLLLAAIAWFAVLYGRKETRPRAEKILQGMPLVRDVVVHLAVASTLKIGGALLRGGVALLSACEIARRGTRMSVVAGVWTAIEQRINSGEPIQRALLHPIFEVPERMIISAHNSQQQLGEIFNIIAARRNELATSAAKRFAIAAFVGSLIYSSASVMTSLYVGYIQNKAVMSAGA